jgi:hypothetical protein
MIVVFTFQSSLLGIKGPRRALKLDPFRERAISRYGESVAVHLGDAMFTGNFCASGLCFPTEIRADISAALSACFTDEPPLAHRPGNKK